MTHLGTQLSALADGRLDPAARERALCHVAACAACAQELAATRAARRALADAGDVPVDPDLAARLMALGAARPGSAPGAPVAPPVLGLGPVLGVPPLASLVPRVGPGRAGGERLADLGPRRPSVRAVAVATVGAVALGLFVLGEERPVVPDAHPATDLALLAAAAVPAAVPTALPGTSGVAAVGAGDGGVAAAAAGAAPRPGVQAPDGFPLEALPPGYVVVAAFSDPTGAEVDLDGPAGPVVVLSEWGRLSDAVLDAVPPTTIGAHEVHVLSVSPWHGVWQSGDAVVGVVAAHRTEAVEALIASYPERSDDGLGAQLSRGWRTVVSAWAP